MNRVLSRLCDQITDVRSAPDQHLLERFLSARDEAAFAELVRRYGPLVWGACRRRLVNVQDAEDAFQAAFLVLVRRAGRLNGDASIGPWLYQVAVMTARNVTRGNRRRGALTGPMEHEVPAPGGDGSAERLDLDAALLALPERERSAVVLCHVQGLTRREAAERLGCPEGTLSARLSRALQRLRTRLGAGFPAVLAGAGVAVPAGLAPATVRSATIYSTSIPIAAGVSPAVVGLTDGVLRMFWMKKAMTTAVAAVLVLGAGVLAFNTSDRSANVARAAEPPAGGAKPAAPQETDPLKRVEQLLADLQKQKELLNATMADLAAEKARLENAKKAKDEAAELGSDLDIMVAEGGNGPSYTVREVINGKIGQIRCSDTDVLAKYLARAFNDPKGPKKLRLHAQKRSSDDSLKKVFEACAAAGYKSVSFSANVPAASTSAHTAHTNTFNPPVAWLGNQINSPISQPWATAGYANPSGLFTTVYPYPLIQANWTEKGEIDLTKYAPKKP